MDLDLIYTPTPIPINKQSEPRPRALDAGLHDLQFVGAGRCVQERILRNQNRIGIEVELVVHPTLCIKNRS